MTSSQKSMSSRAGSSSVKVSWVQRVALRNHSGERRPVASDCSSISITRPSADYIVIQVNMTVARWARVGGHGAALSDVLALLACDGAGPPPDEEATQHVHQDAHHAGSVIED